MYACHSPPLGKSTNSSENDEDPLIRVRLRFSKSTQTIPTSCIETPKLWVKSKFGVLDIKYGVLPPLL